MRLFRYKNVRMLFIPLFGGLAQGKARQLDATKNAIVAIEGPVFGLISVVAAVAAALALESLPWLVKFAWISLGLNALNLLPFMPLDGGQFTNETMFSRYPVLEFVFRLVAIACLGWLAWDSRDFLLGLLMSFMLVTTPANYRRAITICSMRRDPIWQTSYLPESILRA